MKQLRIKVQNRQQVGQIFHFLTDFDLLPDVSSVPNVIEQLTVWIEDAQLVDELVDQLSDRDFVTAIEVTPLWPANGQVGPANVRIIEFPGCPMISQSRCGVLDVMAAYKQGSDAEMLGKTFNLFPEQVQVTIDYIEAHYQSLEQQLEKALILNAEREEEAHNTAREREKKRPRDDSPRRQKLRTLIAARRHEWGIADASYPQ